LHFLDVLGVKQSIFDASNKKKSFWVLTGVNSPRLTILVTVIFEHSSLFATSLVEYNIKNCF